MLLTRLYLRNFRVFEDELELAVPPGLVGIYGPNGAGKSTLLEAVLFTLWGKARTAKEEVRTAGTSGDCVSEVGFEHEGHEYVVRRSLSGVNSAVRAEVRCDGEAIAEGVRDTGRYMHQVLGMDDAAFRASVFAEQKQLAAFSQQAPSERRRLVLELLGITPLDAARDSARRDAKVARDSHQALRAALPDPDALKTESEDAAAHAAAAAAAASEAARVAAVKKERAALAVTEATRHNELRQHYDLLVVEGKGARRELESAQKLAAELEIEVAGLAEAEAELSRLRPTVSAMAQEEERAGGSVRVLSCVVALSGLVTGPEPPSPSVGLLEGVEGAWRAARERVVAAQGRRGGLVDEHARASERASKSATLSGAADCPLCGQALGDTFEAVRAHQLSEVASAAQRLAAADSEVNACQAAAKEAEAALVAARSLAEAQRAKRDLWEAAVAQRAEAEREAQKLAQELSDRHPSPAEGSSWPALDDLPGWRAAAEAAVAARDASRRAAAAAERLAGRLEQRPRLLASLAAARENEAGSKKLVDDLLVAVRGVGFEARALEEAQRLEGEARRDAEQAQKTAVEADREAVRAKERADAAARRVADAQGQRAELERLSGEANLLGRLSDLLVGFRNTMVGAVGPRLAEQASDLFGELTDREYDQLSVDPEDFSLQISDGGRSYGMERFSGSETDLANLALRVAISEHVRFQSGGSVGLLVLDEVFGPLDEERKTRMLLALERLRGRFRQVLVVTHDLAIKEQLPNAIEVVKRPGRRATARVMTS